MIETKSYGAAADAAAVWAALRCEIAPKKMHVWTQFIFNLFEINNSEDSYSQLIQTLKEETESIEILVEAVANHPDYEELFNFVATFIYPDWKKMQVNSDDMLGELKAHQGEQTTLCKESEVLLKVVGCELKNMVLDEEKGAEIIQYIEIPDQTFEELSSDFKHAKHLEFLQEIADEVPKKLLFMAKQDLGLLACQYLSSLLNEDTDCYDEDEQFIGKIPLINSQDLNAWHGGRTVSVSHFSGPIGLEYIARREGNSFQPWYTIYEKIPLIIIIKSHWFLGNDFLDKIKLLEETHKSIWIIFEEPSDNSPPLFRERSDNRGEPRLIEDIYWTLNYPVYKIEEPDIASDPMFIMSP